MKGILKIVRRFRSKLEEKEVIKDYIDDNGFNIDKLINQYYGYVYIIVNNLKSISISNEDMEEIISDTFLGIWKNSSKLDKNVPIKPYLVGIIKNVIRNKYRTTKIDYSISDYEDIIIDATDFERIAEEKEQNEIIKSTLKNMKKEDYEIFIMFYYESKRIKEIASQMEFSESKVKVILHRIRKEIKKNLKNGGYSYGK